MSRTQGTRPQRNFYGALILVAGVFGAAPPAVAQTRTDTAIVSVNYGIQLDTQRLSQAMTLEKYVEPAPVTATMANKAVPFFDIGMTLRLAGALGANVALSYLSDTDTADVSARIPHPFYFNQARAISGQAGGVEHKEIVVHTDVAYVIASPSIDLVLLGGASFFQVDQEFVTDVTFTESFPFDTATFRGATLVRGSASKTGYNAAADVTWRIGRAWGLGGIIRYSRARVPFTVGGIDFGSVDVGGLQAGGGLRLTF